MVVHVASVAAIPHDGVFAATHILPEKAGAILSQAMADNSIGFHIYHRAVADIVERITDSRIPSRLLRLENHPEWKLATGDLMICVTLNYRGRRKRAKLKNGEAAAPFDLLDYDFIRVEKVG